MNLREQTIVQVGKRTFLVNDGAALDTVSELMEGMVETGDAEEFTLQEIREAAMKLGVIGEQV